MTALVKNTLKIIFCCCYFLFISNNLSSQFYQSGQDPASIRWRQIKTPHFQIIFPSEFEKEANRLANALDYLYGHVSQTLGYKPRKISVLLHSQSSISNGMVTWAPKRMELYTTPAQDNYAQDWLDQLAVHELRHVVQINKLNQGITQIASILFGQQAVGAVTGLMPRWFLEGDAITTETALTSSGRGRMASFEMEMKTLVTNSESLFSYEKMLRGSYKDYIPDAYAFGYPMVAWVRKNYGPTVFSNDLNYIGQNPFVLFPFPLSLKKQIGLPSGKLYQTAYSDLKQQWLTQTSAVKPDQDASWDLRKNRDYTSYRFPQFVNDTTMLAVKSGIDQLTEFVLVYKSGKEKKVHTPGNFTNDKFSYADGKYVWAEEIPDARWTNRSYNCIKIGDFRTNSVRLLTKKTRYFAPSLSPDGKKIAAIEVSLSNDIFLVILDAKTGHVLERIPSPRNNFLQLPDWLANGNEIVMVTTDRKGKSLVIYNIPKDTWQTLIAKTVRNITSPTGAGDFVLFTADYNGTDNLYAINRKDTSIWQVTDAKYGITDARFLANSGSVGFAKYTSHGFDIVSSSFQQNSWVSLKNISDHSPKLYETVAKQENFNFQDSIIPDKKYEVTHYSKLAHTINVHSWAPFYYDYNNLTNYSNNFITPGFSLLSQDKLGTCISSAGYSYDHGQSYLKAGVTYAGLYPVINFSTTYGGEEIVNRPESVASPTILNKSINLLTQIYLPLDLTRSRFVTGVVPEIDWQYRNELLYNLESKTFSQGMNYISYILYAYSYLRPSLRDIAPKWGISFTAGYSNTPFENTFLSAIGFAQGRVYLPGLLKHHSLKLTLGYQEQSPLMYYFPITYLPFPRGYQTETSLKLTTFTADYNFPIAYPDLALGALLYVKRIRGNLFYDVAARNYIENNQNVYGQLSSVGLDLTADFHFLRIIFPVNAGLRMIYIPQLNQYTSQLLLTVDLSNY